MLNCWEANPKNRPTFSAVVERLSLWLESMAGYLDIGAFGQQPVSVSIAIVLCS